MNAKPNPFQVSDKVVLLIPLRRSEWKWMKPVLRTNRVYCVEDLATAKATGEPAISLVGVTARNPGTGKAMVFMASSFRRIGRRAKEEA